MNYIINNDGIVFFHKGKPLKINKGGDKFARALSIFELPEAEMEAALTSFLDVQEGFASSGKFTVTPESVTYENEPLPDVLADKIRSLLRDGLPVSLFEKFWENLQNNPSFSSVNELYDFLAYKELPITSDGHFIAYKGVREDGLSVQGNKQTKVLSGKVNGGGQIYNGVGERIQVLRRDVDDDRNVQCGSGVHVGSLDYAKDWGAKTVVVKVNPKDVVAVPRDHNAQKCRVCAYTVIDDFTNEITASATDASGEAMVSSELGKQQDLVGFVDDYLDDNLVENGIVYVSDIVEAYNADDPFTTEYTNENLLTRVCVAMDSLGYIWYDGPKGPTVEL